jgi:hypothetical protein
MVRGHDADDFDVFVIQDLAVVFDRFGLALADLFVISSPFSMVCIDIAHGNDVPEAVMVVRIAGSHATQSDATDLHAILKARRMGLIRP